MEDYAVILANDLVVKASNFGGINNLGFNKQGKVISFIYEGQKNIALFDFKSNMFLDYVEDGYFNKLKVKEVHKEGDKYDGVEKTLWASYVFKKYDKLIHAQFNDKIYGILRDDSGLCYNKFTWTYTNPYKGPVNPILAPNTNSQGSLCETFGNGTSEKAFFDTYKEVKFFDNNESDIRLIGEIASLLKSAGEKTAQAFLNFNLTGVNTTAFTFRTAENGFVREDFVQFKKGLELWLKMLKKYQSEIGKLGHEEQLFIAIDVMYRHNMLTLLTPDQRISILKILVEKSVLMNWYWVNFSIGFVHKEDLAIKILESFTNSADANLFLEKLVSTNVIESQYKQKKVVYKTKYITLYKMLFYRMDDYGGKDNFTKFVEELNRIVLLKNNIEKREIPPEYTSEQLKQVTNAQFIWREKRAKKGPNKDRRKYEIISNTDKKIEIKETIFFKVKLQEVYTANSVGIPVLTGYEEVTTEKIETLFPPLNHFDLVSIHFYDNPSFIDLTSDESYKGKHYFTFAGFIDYLLEKEETKVAEEVFNAALYAISLSFGFGEIIAAVRGINVLRAFLGVVMISSDTGVYLGADTSFRNYIVAKYPHDYQEILNNMQVISTFFSFGTNVVAGSGILNQFSKAEATKFIGTAEAILKDSDALATLSVDEIAGLKEIVKKVKNELYIVRNEEEIIHTIVRTQTKVRLNKFPDLKNELEIISEVSKNRFYDDFYNITEDFIIDIEKTPDFIGYWDSLSDAEKLSLNLNKMASYKTWYVIRTEIKALEKFNLKLTDLDTGKPFRLPECRTWVDLQTQSKGLFEPLAYGKIGDVLGLYGNYKGVSLSGKTIDFWGLPKGALISNNFNGTQRIKSIGKLLDSIDDHFIKFFNSTRFSGESLDIFVMDLRYYDQDLEIKNIVLNYINDPNYFYKNLRDNPNYFILINN